MTEEEDDYFFSEAVDRMIIASVIILAIEGAFVLFMRWVYETVSPLNMTIWNDVMAVGTTLMNVSMVLVMLFIVCRELSKRNCHARQNRDNM